MMHPLAAMTIVFGTLGGLLGGLTLYRRVAAPHPELLRKLLHVGMGLVTLALPWLFDRAWPVLVLCGLSVILLVSLRSVARLRASVGQVVSGVSRFSLGEIYFPLAVVTLWLLYLNTPPEPASRRLLGYVIPLLLLAISDAVAALIGVAYGRWRYTTPDGMKSIEGSFAFFLSSFICIHVPLLLMTDRGRTETLLIALLLAWLATMFEAIAWSGLDNLILPLVAHLLLLIYWDQSADALLQRLGATAALTAFALALHHWTLLRGSAVLGAALIGYVCWALGGWAWLLPPLVLFTASAVLSLRYPANKDKTINVQAVVGVTAVGLIWLFLAQVQERPEWLYPFTVSFAAQLSMVTLGRLRFAHPKASAALLLGVSVGAGWLLMLALYVRAQHESARAIQDAVVALPVVTLAVVAFYLIQPGMDDCPVDRARWVRQAACAAVASVLVVLPGLLLN